MSVRPVPASLVEYDEKDNLRAEASISSGNYLYRITSASFADRLSILNGRASLRSNEGGRYHSAGHLTTYCADNILVAMSEVLYHDYRLFLQRVYELRTRSILNTSVERDRSLVLVSMRQQNDLAFVGSKAIQRDYGVGGTLVVFPDQTYLPLQRLRISLEGAGKQGVVFPSARHSNGMCVAFFGDKSSVVESVDVFKIKLRLLGEDFRRTRAAGPFDGHDSIAHATMGHYEFSDEDYGRLKSKPGLNPADIKQSGAIDFVRRDYLDNYPEAACPDFFT